MELKAQPSDLRAEHNLVLQKRKNMEAGQMTCISRRTSTLQSQNLGWRENTNNGPDVKGNLKQGRNVSKPNPFDRLFQRR